MSRAWSAAASPSFPYSARPLRTRRSRKRPYDTAPHTRAPQPSPIRSSSGLLLVRLCAFARGLASAEAASDESLKARRKYVAMARSFSRSSSALRAREPHARESRHKPRAQFARVQRQRSRCTRATQVLRTVGVGAAQPAGALPRSPKPGIQLSLSSPHHSSVPGQLGGQGLRGQLLSSQGSHSGTGGGWPPLPRWLARLPLDALRLLTLTLP